MNNNNNPFGIYIPNNEDLTNATQGGYTLLENGIYYATFDKMDFVVNPTSKLPRIDVSFKIIDETSNKVSTIKDMWMLSSLKAEYKPSIIGKLAGLFICWGVPQELRGIKYFSWVPQGNEDPATRLMQCILNYSKSAKINSSYVSKLMVRVSVEKYTYLVQVDGKPVEKVGNKIVSFIPLDNVDNNQQQVSSNTTTTTDNVEGNKSNNPFDDYI